jgi:hypothetical protein
VNLTVTAPLLDGMIKFAPVFPSNHIESTCVTYQFLLSATCSDAVRSVP